MEAGETFTGADWIGFLTPALDRPDRPDLQSLFNEARALSRVGQARASRKLIYDWLTRVDTIPPTVVAAVLWYEDDSVTSEWFSEGSPRA